MKNSSFMVGSRRIGMDCPTFIIAEIGCNFEGDIERAKEMIEKAAEAGVDAVKFQTVIAEKITTKTAEKFWEIEGCPGETQFEEFKQTYYLKYDEYIKLKKVAKDANLIFFSTPEDDTESIDLLEKVNIPLYKISSMNITHFLLLKRIARTGKPIILSTGASTIGEIEEAVSVIRAEGNNNIAILHCISSYPTKDEDANLRMIIHLQKVFPDIPIGYSDHTMPENGEGILTAAVSLGARIIEKHFTFDNKRPGYDHAISADYEGLKRIVTQIRRVENALGKEYKMPIESELKARLYARRSLVAAMDIPEGTIITREMVDIKRPGTGIEPRFLEIVVGRKAQKDIKADTIIKWDMI